MKHIKKSDGYISNADISADCHTDFAVDGADKDLDGMDSECRRAYLATKENIHEHKDLFDRLSNE